MKIGFISLHWRENRFYLLRLFQISFLWNLVHKKSFWLKLEESVYWTKKSEKKGMKEGRMCQRHKFKKIMKVSYQIVCNTLRHLHQLHMLLRSSKKILNCCCCNSQPFFCDEELEINSPNKMHWLRMIFHRIWFQLLFFLSPEMPFAFYDECWNERMSKQIPSFHSKCFQKKWI